MKKIPKFKTEAEERRFWEEHDSADYVDWSDAEEPSLPKLKPSTRTISLRLNLIQSVLRWTALHQGQNATRSIPASYSPTLNVMPDRQPEVPRHNQAHHRAISYNLNRPLYPLDRSQRQPFSVSAFP